VMALTNAVNPATVAATDLATAPGKAIDKEAPNAAASGLKLGGSALAGLTNGMSNARQVETAAAEAAGGVARGIDSQLPAVQQSVGRILAEWAKLAVVTGSTGSLGSFDRAVNMAPPAPSARDLAAQQNSGGSLAPTTAANTTYTSTNAGQAGAGGGGGTGGTGGIRPQGMDQPGGPAEGTAIFGPGGKEIIWYAAGGIATHKQLAMVGEVLPEAIIPMPDSMDADLRAGLSYLAKGGWRDTRARFNMRPMGGDSPMPGMPASYPQASRPAAATVVRHEWHVTLQSSAPNYLGAPQEVAQELARPMIDELNRLRRHGVDGPWRGGETL